MTNWKLQILFVVTVSYSIGFLSALVISKFGMKWGLADIPKSRSSHFRPTPRGGGLGIPLVAAAVAFGWLEQYHLLVCLALLMAAVAFINDFRELPVSIRFSLQLLAAAVLLGIYKQDLLVTVKESGGIVLMSLAALFLLIYLVASANFFNFMDGIDGIAGCEAVVSFIFLGRFAQTVKGTPEIALLAWSVAAASAGFLLLNFPRARVFMGDVASIFLGFLFASLTIYLTGSIREFLLVASFQAVFYVDCISTIFLRLRQRENIFKPHKKHLYQELVHRAGWTHHRVTLCFAAAQIIVGMVSLLVAAHSLILLIVLWAALFAIYWLIRFTQKFLGDT